MKGCHRISTSIICYYYLSIINYCCYYYLLSIIFYYLRSGSNVGANPLISPPLTLFLQASFATSAVWTVTHELVFLVTREGTGLDLDTCVIFDYEGQRRQQQQQQQHIYIYIILYSLITQFD